MQLFYHSNIKEDHYVLEKHESNHIVRVLRLKIGDEIFLTNGRGDLFIAEIINNNPSACKLRIKKKQENYGKTNYKLHVAIAPTKSIDRFEWFLEKATEIGIDEITPILTSRSERKVIKPERLEKVLVAAMKQSLKAYKPLLNPLTRFENFLQTNHKTNNLFIAHCMDSQRLSFQEVIKENTDTVILIGPEGDFSKDEIDKALDKGFKPVSLGKNRLRTETAGIVASTVAAMKNG